MSEYLLGNAGTMTEIPSATPRSFWAQTREKLHQGEGGRERGWRHR